MPNPLTPLTTAAPCLTLLRLHTADLLRQRLALLTEMRELASALTNLQIGSTLALTIRSVDILRSLVGRSMLLFREHRVRFAFHADGRAVIVPEGLLALRPGLPEWVGAEVPVVQKDSLEAEASTPPRPGSQPKSPVSSSGVPLVFTQSDAFRLLLKDAKWKVERTGAGPDRVHAAGRGAAADMLGAAGVQCFRVRY